MRRARRRDGRGPLAGRRAPRLRDAFLAAAAQLGATAFHVRLPTESSTLGGDVGAWTVGATPLAGNRPAIEALKSADLVVDTMFLLFSKEQLEIQEAGTRILLCIEPIEHLMRLFPTRELRERVEDGEELLGNAQHAALHERARHRLHLPARRLPGHRPQYGYTDTPGPLGPLAVRLPLHRRRRRRRRRQGRDRPGRHHLPVQDLRADADRADDRAGAHRRHPRRLRRRPAAATTWRASRTATAYGIAHIGWGMNEKRALVRPRRPTGAGMGMEAARSTATCCSRPGPNQELGGTNDTPCHVDIPMRNCRLYLDDEPIVVDGDIVVPEMQAPGLVRA